MYFDTTTLDEVLVAVRMGGVTEEQAADGRPLVRQVPVRVKGHRARPAAWRLPYHITYHRRGHVLTSQEIQVDPDGGNKLLQTCPCLLMCCPKLVLG